MNATGVIEFGTKDPKTIYAIEDLLSLVDDFPFERESLDLFFNTAKSYFYVAKKGTLIVGALLIAVSKDPFKEHIFLLKVHPNYDQSIEDDLLSECFRKLKPNTTLTAFCGSEHYERISTLLAFGFQSIGNAEVGGKKLCKFQKQV